MAIENNIVKPLPFLYYQLHDNGNKTINLKTVIWYPQVAGSNLP